MNSTPLKTKRSRQCLWLAGEGFKSISPYLFILLGSIFFQGCLAIDFSTIKDRPFFHETDQVLRTIENENGNDPPIPSNPFLVGSAKVKITTPEGVPLAGYGKRKGRSSLSVHDPVYVRALAVQSGKREVVIVSADLLAISNEMFDAVFEKVNRVMPLNREDLMMTATHTHSGPGGLSNKFWEKFATGPFHPEFFKSLNEQIAAVILEARDNVVPARMRSGRVDAPHLIKNRMVERGSVDPEVGMIQFESLDGTRKTFLINFSAHATVLNSENMSLSGDYPGALERSLERESGTIALFTAGAVADQTANPPSDLEDIQGDKEFRPVKALGETLSEMVQTHVSRWEWVECGPIDSVRVPFHLPPTQIKVSPKRRLPSFFGNVFFDSASALQAVKIDDQLFIGVPADLSSAIGMRIKRYAKKKGYRALIFGFANDYVGYIIPENQYRMKAYEARMSFNGPHMDRYIEETVYRLIDTLLARPVLPCRFSNGDEGQQALRFQDNPLP